MKTIIRSIITLALVTAVLSMTSCQNYAPAQPSDNVRPFNMSGIVPR